MQKVWFLPRLKFGFSELSAKVRALRHTQFRKRLNEIKLIKTFLKHQVQSSYKEMVIHRIKADSFHNLNSTTVFILPQSENISATDGSGVASFCMSEKWNWTIFATMSFLNTVWKEYRFSTSHSLWCVYSLLYIYLCVCVSFPNHFWVWAKSVR